MSAPLVGLTCDTIDGRSVCPGTYTRAIEQAGGVPLLLPNRPALAPVYADLCDAFVLTGGEDPDMAPFGEATHPRAVVVHPDRQAFETALLRELSARHPDKPTLGVCLGMQWMALLAGGTLDQHLPDACPTSADHADDRTHGVEPCVPDPWVTSGVITSKHHQAVCDPGGLRVVARAPDGIIEAIDDASRRFYRGVQWHPERTAEPALGIEIYRALVSAASVHAAAARG
ncbi:MAG: gamma-glutamyl-gamma-aminobutyrate hydrolase family protein [Phycisphaeraceae bacterium]|nr:gamma-glutamyl-gamma-aminobutyrate hydrolase family protein [Phycisphaeraceae bacterium]MCB9847366.1 gamma-glutamyl-gamma-aminobutyrate hydrolase family protein [Phycisphaeraceae bacterium]